MMRAYGRHFHKHGNAITECFHKCRVTFLKPGFWLGLTLGFPIEHFVWEKIWPFYLLTKVLGL